MKVEYFEDTDGVMFTFREGADYDDSQEIYEGFVIDLDKSGRPVGLDVQDASKFFDHSWLLKHVSQGDESKKHAVVSETKPQASIIRDAPMKDDE